LFPLKDFAPAAGVDVLRFFGVQRIQGAVNLVKTLSIMTLFIGVRVDLPSARRRLLAEGRQ
jgi:hypothetical protein